MANETIINNNNETLDNAATNTVIPPVPASNRRVHALQGDIIAAEGLLKALGAQIPEWKIGSSTLKLIEEEDGSIHLQSTLTCLSQDDEAWFARCTNRFLADCSNSALRTLLEVKKALKAATPADRGEALRYLRSDALIESSEVDQMWEDMSFDDLSADVCAAYGQAWRALLLAHSQWTDMDSGIHYREKATPLAITISNQLDNATSAGYDFALNQNFWVMYDEDRKTIGKFLPKVGELLTMSRPDTVVPKVNEAWDRVLEFVTECLRLHTKNQPKVYTVWEDRKHDVVEILINYAFRTMGKSGIETLITSIAGDWCNVAFKALGEEFIRTHFDGQFTAEVNKAITNMLKVAYFYSFREQVINALNTTDPVYVCQLQMRREVLNNEIRELRNNH